jgi:hypothetical protein
MVSWRAREKKKSLRWIYFSSGYRRRSIWIVRQLGGDWRVTWWVWSSGGAACMHWRSIDRERRRRRAVISIGSYSSGGGCGPFFIMEVAAPPHKDLFVCPLAPVGRVQGSQRARGWAGYASYSTAQKEFLLASRPSEKSQRASFASSRAAAAILTTTNLSFDL